MHTLRCALAEWQIARVRLLRTRLGLWLVLLGAAFLWLVEPGAALEPAAALVRVGMLGGVLGVAFVAGSDADRAALPLAVTHPTTPAAVAGGRWLGALMPVGALLVGCTALAAWRGLLPLERCGAMLAAGLGAAGAAAAAALVAAWIGGNALVAILFLFMAVPGAADPALMERLVAAPALRAPAILLARAAPSAWRYASLATWDPGTWLHAGAWAVGGLAAAALLMPRWAR